MTLDDLCDAIYAWLEQTDTLPLADVQPGDPGSCEVTDQDGNSFIVQVTER